jgi:hypothetical protein
MGQHSSATLKTRDLNMDAEEVIDGKRRAIRQQIRRTDRRPLALIGATRG